jgi:hypothetical protein
VAHPLLPQYPMPTSAPAPHPGPLYFVNAPVDFALIGGCSIAAYLALHLVPAEGTAQLPILVALLARVCNWPHFAATSYRLYNTRQNVRQYPVTALVVPLVVGAGMAWAFAAPTTVAPVFVKLTLLWSPYHFSGQTLGLSLLYARRAGFTVSRNERLALSTLIFSAFAWATARAETGDGVRHYLGVDHPKLGLPPLTADAIGVVLLLAGAAVVFVVLRWCVRERRPLPPIVLLPALSQLVWFVVGRDFETFQTLVPFFHSLQYLLVAWALHLSTRMARSGSEPSARFVVLETSRWWVWNVVLGLLLFGLSPYLCTLLGYDLLFAMAVTSSAIQLHHFFVDGVIWKLKDPQVSSPLLVNVEQFLRPEPGTLAQAA